MPTVQELQQDLNKVIAEAKEAVLKFKEDRKKFDKIINEYKELRDKKFDTQKKQEYARLKENIKNVEKQIMEYKAEKEDIENLYFLDKTGFEQLCEFFKKSNPQVADIPSYIGSNGGRNGFRDLLNNVDTVEKAKKRLKPLHNIARKYRFKFKNLEFRLNLLKTTIANKNNKILQWKEQKDDLKKQTNPYPSASFGYKIAHSEKVDYKLYLTKIDLFYKNIRYNPYLSAKLLDYYKLKLQKIKARFERIIDFIDSYILCIKNLFVIKPNEKDFINEIADNMKELEQKEMTASLKDKQDLAEQLGISKFRESITQQDVINRADNGTGQIKTSNLTTPNSAFDEGVYWLKTPFKQVRVEVERSSNIMIYPKSKCVAPTYDVISLKLDSIFEDKDNKEVIEKVIDPIINYLKQTVPVPTEVLKNQNLLDKIKPMKADKAERNFLTDEQKEAAATLCGILMLSESHQFRNPTLGKFERSSVKRVKQLALKRIANPFSVVYANKSGEYINAHAKESDSGFDKAIISTKFSFYQNEQAVGDGGHKQTRQLLRCKEIDGDIAVNKADLPEWIQNKVTNSESYVKVKDLDNTKKYPFFEGDSKQTIREFVEKQMNRNMRDQYKKLNRTPKTRE